MLAALVVIALLEWAARPELPALSLLFGIALMPTVLWRRTRPLQMVVIAFGATSAVTLAGIVIGSDLPALHTCAFMLLLPYALLRWEAGRKITLGLSIVLASASLSIFAKQTELGDIIGAFSVLLASMSLGAAARYRAYARTQMLEQVKLREREQLARDLHDTVAHHVSAIAIRAQAGLATTSTNRDSAVEALRVIEAEASRALSEMRAMVRLLRDASSAELAPTPGITDLHRLASMTTLGPEVDLVVCGSTDNLTPAVSAAVFRLAQESVTNARRHARRATRISVRVTIHDASVQLRVSDDGQLTPARPQALVGYGLIGMRERAALLGGSCHAGPGPEWGWTVTVVLPLQGKAA